MMIVMTILILLILRLRIYKNLHLRIMLLWLSPVEVPAVLLLVA